MAVRSAGLVCGFGFGWRSLWDLIFGVLDGKAVNCWHGSGLVLDTR